MLHGPTGMLTTDGSADERMNVNTQQDKDSILAELLKVLSSMDTRLRALEQLAAEEDRKRGEQIALLKAIGGVLLTDKPPEEQEITPQLYAFLTHPKIERMSRDVVTRKARIALAAKRSGFIDGEGRSDVKAWLALCEKHSWNPERKAPPELVEGMQAELVRSAMQGELPC